MPIKVVRKLSNKYYSLYAGGIFKVEYKPGEWVRSTKELEEIGYGLCVYTNVNEVQMPWFASIFLPEDVEIWECEGRGEVRLPPYALQVDLTPSMDFAEFKHIALSDQCFVDWNWSISWPESTRMFQEVKLVKRIG